MRGGSREDEGRRNCVTIEAPLSFFSSSMEGGVGNKRIMSVLNMKKPNQNQNRPGKNRGRTKTHGWSNLERETELKKKQVEIFIKVILIMMMLAIFFYAPSLSFRNLAERDEERRV